MARTNLLGQSSNASGEFGTGAFVTNSFTPPDNSLLVAVVQAIENGGSSSILPDLTISGGGLTFTSRVERASGGPTHFTGIRIWTAPVTTGALMTLTIDCGTRDMAQYAVSVVAYTAYNVGSPIGATGTNFKNTGFLEPEPASLTLSAAPNATSEVLASVGIDKAVAGVTPGTGWTEIHDLHTIEWGGLQSQIRGSSTSTSVDWIDLRPNGGGLFNWAAVAVEIKTADTGSRTVDDTLTIPDTIGLTIVMVISDTLSIIDTGSIISEAAIGTTTITLTDSVSVQLTPIGGTEFTRQVVDTLNVRDLDDPIKFDIEEILAETITLTDNAIPDINAGDQITDTLTISDAGSVVSSALFGSDLLSITDLLFIEVIVTRQIDDNIGLVDAGSQAFRLAAGDDNLSLTDEIIIQFDSGGQITDNLAIVDTVIQDFGKGLNHTVVMTDHVIVVEFRGSVSVVQAIEDDIAQAFNEQKVKTIGQVIHTDTAQVFAEIKNKAIGQATETNVAQPITVVHRNTIGIVTETDESFPVGQPAMVNLVSETDTAQAITVRRIATLGLAVESNVTLLNFAKRKERIPQLAVVSNIAQPIVGGNLILTPDIVVNVISAIHHREEIPVITVHLQ